MDKLKRVLSGRDAEEPSRLDEVTLRSPYTCLPSGGAARRGLGGGWQATVGGSAAVGGGGRWAAPRPLGAGRPSAGLARAASARRWASGSPGRSRPGAAGDGGSSGAGLWTFHLPLESPVFYPARSRCRGCRCLGRGPWRLFSVREDDSVSRVNLGRPGTGRLVAASLKIKRGNGDKRGPAHLFGGGREKNPTQTNHPSACLFAEFAE